MGDIALLNNQYVIISRLKTYASAQDVSETEDMKKIAPDISNVAHALKSLHLACGTTEVMLMEYKLNEFTRSYTRNENLTHQYHAARLLSDAQKDVMVKATMNANQTKLSASSIRLGFNQAGCPLDITQQSSKQLQTMVPKQGSHT